MGRYWAIREGQITFEEVNSFFSFDLNGQFRMIDQGPTYWSKAINIVEAVLRHFELADGRLLGGQLIPRPQIIQ